MSAPAARVYTAAIAASLDGSWTDLQSAKIGDIRQGHGAVVGSASVDLMHGDGLIRNGAAPVNVSAPGTALLGLFLRITYDNNGGVATAFIGRITSLEPRPSSSSTTITAEGILGILGRVHCLRCTEMPPLGDAPAWIEQDERRAWGAPPFSVGIDGGQADPSDMPVGRPPAFDRSASGGRWTAAAATEYLLGRIVSDPLYDGESGPLWALDAASAAALDYDLPRIECHGERVLDILTEIWPQSRNVSFRLSGVNYAGNMIIIEIIDLTTSAGTLDLDNGPFADRTISLQRSVPAVTVTGGAARQMLTLYWDPLDPEDSSLLPDWSTSSSDADILRNAWDGTRENPLPNWRRWTIDPAWSGATAPFVNAGAPADGLQHIQGPDGSRDFATQAGAALVSIRAARMRRGGLAAGDLLPEPLAMALGGDGEAVDLSPYGITCDDDTGTIAIGSTIDDALAIRDALAGRRLLVTVGMDDPEPLAAWSAAAWPAGVPETVQEHHPDLQRIRVAAGAALGIDPASRQIQSSNQESIIRDDQAQLLDLRLRLEERYGRLSGRATFTFLGEDATWQPGQPFAAVASRGETYAFPLVVATVTISPQSQTQRVELVPITAHKGRT